MREYYLQVPLYSENPALRQALDGALEPLADWLRQDEYYARVKAKFTGPVAERFFDTGALCALLDDHRAGKTNAMTKIWAFYCFIEWYEVYFAEQKPPIL